MTNIRNKTQGIPTNSASMKMTTTGFYEQLYTQEFYHLEKNSSILQKSQTTKLQPE